MQCDTNNDNKNDIPQSKINLARASSLELNNWSIPYSITEKEIEKVMLTKSLSGYQKRE